jgi:hypothetical protein
MPISTIGANGLTSPLPAANLGTPSAINLGNATALPKAALPTGSVLQVVQGTLGSSVSTTTNNTWVTTGLAASITPTSSSNKILVTVSGTGYTSGSAVQGVFTLYRGATNLSTYGFTTVYAGSSSTQGGITFSYLDSPSTTSSTKYTLYFSLSNSAGTLMFNSPSAFGQGNATIILQEIAA